MYSAAFGLMYRCPHRGPKAAIIMATEGGGADVRALLAEAGVAQYADALVAAGYDSLPNVLALDEA